MRDATQDYRIRPAESRDAGLIAQHRAAMFRDMGLVSAAEYELLREASGPWLEGLLSKGHYVGWVVEYEQAAVAGGGVLIREMGPVPGCCRVGRWAHVVNVYTKPHHRRRGLARRLMQTILDWCASHAIDHVTLAASDEGRPLYEALGFRPTPEMKLSQGGGALTPQ